MTGVGGFATGLGATAAIITVDFVCWLLSDDDDDITLIVSCHQHAGLAIRQRLGRLEARVYHALLPVTGRDPGRVDVQRYGSDG